MVIATIVPHELKFIRFLQSFISTFNGQLFKCMQAEQSCDLPPLMPEIFTIWVNITIIMIISSISTISQGQRPPLRRACLMIILAIRAAAN